MHIILRMIHVKEVIVNHKTSSIKKQSIVIENY